MTTIEELAKQLNDINFDKQDDFKLLEKLT